MTQTDWNPKLRDQFGMTYWNKLQQFVMSERNRHRVFPAVEDTFAALHHTGLADTRVVILGQDPYHGPGQAHGLSFSVRRGTGVPPSLRNIHAELRDDLGVSVPDHGSLEGWAKNGVLLLNSVLTVRAHSAGSHRGKGWEVFTDRVIEVVAQKRERVVFVLWGNYARQKRALISAPQHFVIESPHPSPLAANRGFFGSRPFSRANEALVAVGIEPVDWSLG